MYSMVHNTALMSSSDTDSFSGIRKYPERWGRYVESAVGVHLLDGCMKNHYNLFYWRKGNMEVDFVLVRGDKILALEVKSGSADDRSGLAAFRNEYPHSTVMLVGDRGIPWQKFLRMDLSGLV